MARPTPEPTAAPTSAPLALTPATEQGVDLLWKFQLRKENAALLEKLEANEKLIQDCTIDSNRTFQDVNEKFATLEAQMQKIESEEKKDRQVFENWGAEVRSLKRKVDGIKDSLGMTAESRAQSIQMPSINATPRPALPQPLDSTSTVNSRARHEPEGNAMSIVPNATTTNQPTTPAPRMNPAPLRPANRKRSEPSSTQRVTRSVASSKPTVSKPMASSPPRLLQATSALKNYHAKASSIFASLEGDKNEIEFVSQFIRGMRDPKQREVLIKTLQMSFGSRTGRDGDVQIFCEWVDVLGGLKRSGLVEVDGSEGPSAKRGRRFLIPPEMVKKGMKK